MAVMSEANDYFLNKLYIMKTFKKLIIINFVFAFIMVPMVFAASTPFSDHDGHKWENAIEFVFNRGIVDGYPDGTYRPDTTLNRAELLKVIVAASYPSSSYSSYAGDACFNDMTGDEWYAEYVCFGKAQGIVEGYQDGEFKAINKVNFVEALKIMLVGMDVGLTSSTTDPWYQLYYETAEDKYLVPDELTYDFVGNFSRAQAAEVIKRILSLDANIGNVVYTSEGGYEPGTVYIGYLQEGNALDLYLIADTSIVSYSFDNFGFSFTGNNVVDFVMNNGVYGSPNGNSLYITSGHTLGAGEQIHFGTVYLESTDSVTIEAL